MIKIKRHLVIVLILLIILSGCGNDNVDETKIDDNSNDLEEFARDLNKAMFKSKDFDEMKKVFDSYRERINDNVYANYFNVKDRLVASLYYTEAQEIDYEEIEVIVVDEEDKTVIYIASIYTEVFHGNKEFGIEEFKNEIKSLNKYVFKNNILVGFNRVF